MSNGMEAQSSTPSSTTRRRYSRKFNQKWLATPSSPSKSTASNFQLSPTALSSQTTNHAPERVTRSNSTDSFLTDSVNVIQVDNDLAASRSTNSAAQMGSSISDRHNKRKQTRGFGAPLQDSNEISSAISDPSSTTSPEGSGEARHRTPIGINPSPEIVVIQQLLQNKRRLSRPVADAQAPTIQEMPTNVTETMIVGGSDNQKAEYLQKQPNPSEFQKFLRNCRQSGRQKREK